jgi:hypothetical protein
MPLGRGNASCITLGVDFAMGIIIIMRIRMEEK